MRLLLLVLLFAANSAMAAVPDAPAPDPAPSVVPAEPPPPLSVWRPNESGGLEHLQSGMPCPARLAPYLRTNVIVYDGFGLDVSCNYDLGADRITVFLTRRNGQSLEALLADAKSSLVQVGAPRHPQLISDTSSIQAGLTWTTTLYSEDGDVRTGIWMTDLSGWMFEFRATYATAHEAQVLAGIKALTDLVQQTAGLRLAQCAKSQAPERRGKPVTNREDMKQAALMTSLLAMAPAANASEGAGALGAPDAWCVEETLESGDRHALLWRGVDEAAVDTRTDRITLATVEASPTLVVAPDSMAAFVGGENKPPRWVATFKDGDQVLIFGYFDGRPTGQAMSALLIDILTGKAKTLGGYSRKGKEVTIIVPGKP